MLKILVTCGAFCGALATPVSAQRAPLTGPTTFLVATAGVDTTTCGSSVSPCRTKQGAYNAALLIDGTNNAVTISDPSCADSAPLIATPLVGVSQPIYVTGNVGSPCTVTNSGGGDAFWFDGPAKFALSGFAPSSSGGLNGNSVHASRGVEVVYGAGMVLGGAGTARSFADAARIVYSAAITIGSGTSSEVDHVINGGVIAADGQTFTCASGHSITSYWLGNGGGWSSYTGASFSGCNNVAQPYFVHLNGASKHAGVTLPGGSPGNSINGNVDDVVSGLQVGEYGSIWLGPGQTAASAVQIQSHGGNLYITPPSGGNIYLKNGVIY